MKVLIVDDSPLIIARIVELLYDVKDISTVKTCGTYTDGVQLLHQFVPDVTLLDIKLPDKSGLELLTYTKKNFPSCIVIMVSNESFYYPSLCIKLGANYYVDKSKDFDKIPAIISSLK